MMRRTMTWSARLDSVRSERALKTPHDQFTPSNLERNDRPKARHRICEAGYGSHSIIPGNSSQAVLALGGWTWDIGLKVVAKAVTGLGENEERAAIGVEQVEKLFRPPV